MFHSPARVLLAVLDHDTDTIVSNVNLFLHYHYKKMVRSRPVLKPHAGLAGNVPSQQCLTNAELTLRMLHQASLY